MIHRRAFVTVLTLLGLLALGLSSDVVVAADDVAGSFQDTEQAGADHDYGARSPPPEDVKDSYRSRVPDVDDAEEFSAGSTMQTRGFHERVNDKQLTKQQRIDMIEDEVDRVVEEEVRPALDGLLRLQMQHQQIKRNMPWFPSAEEKQRLAAVEAETQRATMALQRAQSHELVLRKSLKPLYGLVSYQFMKEQRENIVHSVKKVNDMAYNQAWYSSLFNSHRAESLTDVVVGFFMQWLVAYAFMYPFAWLYYALWSAPRSILEYSSSVTDFGTGVMMWAGWVTVMSLPMIIIGALIYYIARTNPALANRMRRRF